MKIRRKLTQYDGYSPTYTWRTNNVIITAKRRRNVVFDIIVTLLLRHVSTGSWPGDTRSDNDHGINHIKQTCFIYFSHSDNISHISYVTFMSMIQHGEIYLFYFQPFFRVSRGGPMLTIFVLNLQMTRICRTRMWPSLCPWWRHQMETFSESLAICAGNSPAPVNSPHKGQWRGALMFSLICVWINDWVNNREAGD